MTFEVVVDTKSLYLYIQGIEASRKSPGVHHTRQGGPLPFPQRDSIANASVIGCIPQEIQPAGLIRGRTPHCAAQARLARRGER